MATDFPQVAPQQDVPDGLQEFDPAAVAEVPAAELPGTESPAVATASPPPAAPKPPRRSPFDVYTVMLIISAASVTLACLFLAIELSHYAWQVKPPT